MAEFEFAGAVSSRFDPAEYDLTSAEPLKMGFDPHDCFNGSMCELRLYERALLEAEIQDHDQPPEPPWTRSRLGTKYAFVG